MRSESYQQAVQEHLQSLGLWDKLIAGKLKCFVCKDKLSRENFGLAFREGEKMESTCNKIDCIRKATTVVKD